MNIPDIQASTSESYFILETFLKMLADALTSYRTGWKTLPSSYAPL